MKFDELDNQMRVFETANDYCVLPGIHIVARLDGRSFTRLTKEVHDFTAPFDVRFRDLMLDTVENLMIEFSAVYGYTQSDEISLLLPMATTIFNRKLRKLNSVMAACASAKFSLSLGAMACFDCRICELPQAQQVVDYFRWRHEDAHRNALEAHCYWLLRRQGLNAATAAKSLAGLPQGGKTALLSRHGIEFADLPPWQKRGVGLFWGVYQKEGLNPVTGQRVTATRRRLQRELQLPLKDAYGDFVRTFVDAPRSG
jgi:tRNA(His) guanylyltransferase